MAVSFLTQLNRLHTIAPFFDPDQVQKKKEYLVGLSRTAIPINKQLIRYVELLLFMAAHPSSKQELELTEKELKRITKRLKTSGNVVRKNLCNSGLPFMPVQYKFSHDLSFWLDQQTDVQVSLKSFEDGTLELNDALKATLPSIERELTTMELSNEELLDYLEIKPAQRLRFVLGELSKLDANPMVKDHYYDGLGIQLNVLPKNDHFSRIYNRIPQQKVFFHQDILKKFDHQTLLHTGLPEPARLSEVETAQLAKCIKYSMALTVRETDPATYLDPKSLRLYELERGISIALFSMESSRQLPFESYVGFTLFKNGFPASYGGGWVFGKRSMFGINVFEPYRGGESGYMMCQLLRVYRQAFGVDFFEVEPYQYGLDNPEGIASGAFWFYYRFGFRPLDKGLLKLSLQEHTKIVQQKGYRSSSKTLLKFTESNIGLQMADLIPPTVADQTNKIKSMIKKEFAGDRKQAVAACIDRFIAMSGLDISQLEGSRNVLEEFSLLAAALPVVDEKRLQLMAELVILKAKDLYRYQRKLQEFL